MTREEKIKELNRLCDSFDTCDDCVLQRSCIPNWNDATDAQIDSQYAIITQTDEQPEDELPEEQPDMVNRPPHYTHGMECIDEMIAIFGVASVMNFCICNAWKYRKRALYKNGQEDMDKADWYIKKYMELKQGVASNV